MIDDQDDALKPSAITCAHDMCAIRQMPLRQNRLPARMEGALIARLKGLDTASQRPAVADAFVMHDTRTWLVEHPVTVLTQPEGKIAVLTIGRSIDFIEAAQSQEQLTRHHQR